MPAWRVAGRASLSGRGLQECLLDGGGGDVNHRDGVVLRKRDVGLPAGPGSVLRLKVLHIVLGRSGNISRQLDDGDAAIRIVGVVFGGLALVRHQGVAVATARPTCRTATGLMVVFSPPETSPTFVGVAGLEVPAPFEPSTEISAVAPSAICFTGSSTTAAPACCVRPSVSAVAKAAARPVREMADDEVGRPFKCARRGVTSSCVSAESGQHVSVRCRGSERGRQA